MVAFCRTGNVGKGDQGTACATVEVEGNAVGFPTVTVSRSSSVSNDGGGVPVSASAVVGFYEKLRLYGNDDGNGNADSEVETLLVIGSWHTLKFVGGPSPWVNAPGSHFTHAKPEDGSLVKTKNLKALRGVGDGGVYGVDVVCSDVGETRLTFTVGKYKICADSTRVECR